ncbi:MAG: methyltransferase [Hyphomicrobiales bacterium]|nr:methyltransferase [Hyphomicrobiales bacterium]
MSPPSEKIVGLYERHADAFDRERGKSLFERAWLNRFTHPLQPGSAILDLGCGSGEPIARHLVGRSYAITGIDSSPAMIGICKSRFPEQVWVEADMRRLLLGRRFAGIIAWDSYFHLTPSDQRAMFPIFAAHSAPGAMLMFTSGPEAGVSIGTFQGEALYHASLDPQEYAALLLEHSFVLLSHVVEDPDCGGRTIWLARYAGMDPR